MTFVIQFHVRFDSIVFVFIRNFQCPECSYVALSNNEIMDHIKAHVSQENKTETSVQCRYCLTNIVNHKLLDEHLSTNHPIRSKSIKLYCLICSVCI